MRSLLAVSVLAVLAISCGQSGSSDPTSTSTAKKELTTLAPKTYEESPGGLQKMMDDLFGAVAKGDDARADMLARSLRVVNYATWFQEVFGTELGTDLAAEYSQVARRIKTFSRLAKSLHDKKQTKVAVERYDSPDDPAAVAYQAEAIQRMLRITPLYSVRVSNEDDSKMFHIWSFVYQDGLFRWVGKLKAVASEPTGQGDVDLREYRVRDFKKARDIMKKR